MTGKRATATTVAKLVGKRLPRRTKITVRAGSGFVTGTAAIVAVGAATVHVCVAGEDRGAGNAAAVHAAAEIGDGLVRSDLEVHQRRVRRRVSIQPPAPWIDAPASLSS